MATCVAVDFIGMSAKPPTISLPFTNYEASPPKPAWYNILTGSRLRNRALALAASLSTFLILVFALRSTVFGQAIETQGLQNTVGTVHSSSAHIYDGVDVSFSDVEHLVVVAGHAIWLGGQTWRNDSDWILEPHQLGQVATLVEHIKKGAELSSQRPRSLLVFSGGNTRSTAGVRSESESYANLLELLARDDPSLAKVSFTSEEFARDSYENLIFSVARFYEVTGRYPRAISVVGFEFKKRRFIDLHRKAIRFPESKFSYHGVDPPDLEKTSLVGEVENAKSHFEHDLYGCKDPELLAKKKSRNPSRRRHGYELSNPQLAGLLDFCPDTGDRIYDGVLPWT